MKQRLAVILDTYPRATEQFVYRGLLELRKRGVDMHVFYLKPGDGPDMLAQNVFRLPSIFNPRYLLANLKFIWRIRRAFWKELWETFFNTRRMSRDIYHFKMAVSCARCIAALGPETHIHAEFAGLPARYARLAGEFLRCEYTIAAHARDILVADDDLKANLAGARFVLFCTAAMRDRAAGMVQGLEMKSEVVYHGLELAEIPQARTVFRDDVLRIAAAGRFVEKKGFECLIRACRILRDRKIRLQCRIAGEGERLESCRALAAELGLDKEIEFPGFLDQKGMEELFKNCDVLCVPSIKARDGDMDGIPNVILEAAQWGVPAVVSDLPQIIEAVQGMENGITVSPGSETDLAAGLERYRNLSPAEKRHLSANACKVLTGKFDIKRNTDQLLEIFKRRGVEL